MTVLQAIIENKESKEGVSKTGNSYTMSTLTLNGKKYSSFGECDFKVGDKIQVVVTESGKYLNYSDPVLLEEGMEVTEEEVKDEPKGAISTQIEVIELNDPVAWKLAINAANVELNVFATQTHVTLLPEGAMNKVLYTAVLFYKP